ncbi:MAG: DUF1559 domain-containing protein [Pirellulales bacterium]
MLGSISLRHDRLRHDRLRHDRRQTATRSLGFTLVELLVVIAIIAMLTALLVPAVQRAREAGRRATCMNNQSQIGKAVMNYATSKDRLPSGFSNHPDTTVGTYCMGWVPPMLPYIEQKPLYDQIMSSAVLVSTALPRKYEIPLLICPTWSRTGSEMAPLSYVVNAGMNDLYPPTGNASRDYQENGVFFDHFKPAMPPVGKAVTTDLSFITRNDGTSSTVLFSESVETRDWLGRAGPTSPYWPNDASPPQDQGSTWWQGIVWYTQGIPSNGVGYLNRPAQPGVPLDDRYFAKPTSQHPGGFLMTFVDGHTLFVSEDVDYHLYALVMAPASKDAKEPDTGKTGMMLYTGTNWYDPATGALRTVTEADLTR